MKLTTEEMAWKITGLTPRTQHAEYTEAGVTRLIIDITRGLEEAERRGEAHLESALNVVIKERDEWMAAALKKRKQ